MANPFFTIFTPTYNRGYCLNRVYDSLLTQSDKDFEWVIVDDGSKDNTKEIVSKWISEAKIDIKYYHQENGGKHIAINHGVSKAKGELFLIADSDDEFTKDTLSTFRSIWDEIGDDNNFAGIWCLCKDVNGNIVGDKFPRDKWDGYYFDRIYKNNIQGEKWHIEKLAIMKEFPFPDLRVGDGFYFGESTIWNKIYKKYKARHINEALRIYFDSEDGIINQMQKNPYRYETRRLGALAQINNDIDYFFHNPRNFLFIFHSYIKSSFALKIKVLKQFKKLKPTFSRLIFICMLPLSWVIYTIKGR